MFALPEVPPPPTVASALTIIAVVLHGVWTEVSKWRGKREEGVAAVQRAAHVEQLFASNDLANEQRFNILAAGVDRVSAFVIGPDGENGLRGDVREIKGKLDEIEKRERERLLEHTRESDYGGRRRGGL